MVGATVVKVVFDILVMGAAVAVVRVVLVVVGSGVLVLLAEGAGGVGGAKALSLLLGLLQHATV